MSINEKALTKGQIRKLNALRKSIGDDLGEQAFAKWLKRQSSAKKIAAVDPVAQKIEAALSGLVKDKGFRLGNLGYTVRRAKGKGASGFVVTKNVKS
jgi:hypothetical protein